MTLAHITIAASDVRRTSTFFEKVFSWKPLHEPGNIKISAAWLEIAPGQQLHILEIPGYEPSPFEAEFGRHIALFHPAADMASLKQRLVDEGAELIDAIRETPFHRFFFREANGYVFEVIDQDGYVAE